MVPYRTRFATMDAARSAFRPRLDVPVRNDGRCGVSRFYEGDDGHGRETAIVDVVAAIDEIVVRPLCTQLALGAGIFRIEKVQTRAGDQFRVASDAVRSRSVLLRGRSVSGIAAPPVRGLVHVRDVPKRRHL